MGRAAKPHRKGDGGKRRVKKEEAEDSVAAYKLKLKVTTRGRTLTGHPALSEQVSQFP